MKERSICGRPVLIALIGYIIGIIWELYFKISIAFLYTFIIASIIILQYIISIKYQHKHSKKLRIIKTILISKSIKKVIIIIFVFALVSSIIVKYVNNKYENQYQNIEQAIFIATIIEERKEKQYYLQYKIRIEQINNKKVKHHHLLLKLKGKKQRLEIGNKIQFQGKYQEPQGQRNEKGINYKLYLKAQKIYGTVTSNSVKVLKSQNQNLFSVISNKIVRHSTNSIQNLIKSKEEQNLLLGILIGKDDNISQELKENFSNSSLSHILAISGMHVSYVIIGISILLSTIKLSKNISKILIFILLCLFCSITGFSASIVRAVFMAIISIIASLIHRKNDIITTFSITLFITLINNPFSIFNVGLILSYLGTIGILTLYPIFLNKFEQKNKELYLSDKLSVKEKLYKNIVEIVLISISAQISILPVILYNFNNLSLTFLISNILASFIIGPILILGFTLILFNLIFVPITKLIITPLTILLKALITIANCVSNLPLSHILLPTPKIHTIIMYYVLLIVIYYLIKHNKFAEIMNKIVHNKKIVIIIVIVCLIGTSLGKLDKNLRIHFIDVGQGDSTLIITPNQKTILVDGGGSSSEEFDVGKSTLVPFLLDKGITVIDYIIISHFDTDHVRTEC